MITEEQKAIALFTDFQNYGLYKMCAGLLWRCGIQFSYKAPWLETTPNTTCGEATLSALAVWKYPFYMVAPLYQTVPKTIANILWNIGRCYMIYYFQTIMSTWNTTCWSSGANSNLFWPLKRGLSCRWWRRDYRNRNSANAKISNKRIRSLACLLNSYKQRSYFLRNAQTSWTMPWTVQFNLP